MVNFYPIVQQIHKTSLFQNVQSIVMFHKSVSYVQFGVSYCCIDHFVGLLCMLPSNLYKFDDQVYFAKQITAQNILHIYKQKVNFLGENVGWGE